MYHVRRCLRENLCRRLTTNSGDVTIFTSSVLYQIPSLLELNSHNKVLHIPL